MATEALAWHYLTLEQFRQVKASGLVKSRALLISEELQKRPDWELLRRDSKALEAALPAYLTHRDSFLRHRPIIWFSKNQVWETQSWVPNESKNGEWLDQRGAEMPGTFRETMRQAYESSDGLIRLGMPQSRLLGWIALMVMSGMSWCFILEYHLSDLVLGGYNLNHVMGYIGDSLPLSEITRMERFVNPPNGEWEWVPIRY